MKNIKDLYNLTASQYDKRYKQIQFDKIRFILNKLNTSLKNKKILDLGAGTGFLERFLLKQKLITKNQAITLIDISRNMLNIAKTKLKNCKYKYKLKNLEKPLNLKQKLDLIFSITVLQNIKKSKRRFFIKQIKNHLKKDGIAAITTLNKNIAQKEFKELLKTFKTSKIYKFSEDLIAITKNN